MSEVSGAYFQEGLFICLFVHLLLFFLVGGSACYQNVTVCCFWLIIKPGITGNFLSLCLVGITFLHT